MAWPSSYYENPIFVNLMCTFRHFCCCCCLWVFGFVCCCTGHFMTLAVFIWSLRQNSSTCVALYSICSHLNCGRSGAKKSTKSATPERAQAQKESTLVLLLLLLLLFFLNACRAVVINEHHRMPESQHLMVFHIVCYVITLARSSMFCVSSQFGISSAHTTTK